MTLTPPRTVTAQWLNENPNAVFVFGDNIERRGIGGAAQLRYHPQSYGFITKKSPTHDPSAFFKPDEYLPWYEKEVETLMDQIAHNPQKIFLISRVGAGLANRHKIFEEVIQKRMRQDLHHLRNVIFLW